MKKTFSAINRHRSVFAWIVIAIVIIGLIVSYFAWHSQPLLEYRYVGGNCATVCQPTIYTVRNDGTFSGHSKLSGTELSQLRSAIAKTDFRKYPRNPNPQCPSFADGQDEVLMFPQKYGTETFVICQLNISSGDPTLNFINGLLKAHLE